MNAVCVNKQSNISKLSLNPQGRDHLLIIFIFPVLKSPVQCGKSTYEWVCYSLYTDRPDTCWGQDVPDSVWVQLLPSPYPSLPAQSPAFQHVLRGRDFLPEWLAAPQILLIPLSISSFFFFLRFNFIYFWLHWVFVAERGLSLVVASGGYSSLRRAGFSLQWLLLLRSTGSRHTGFSTCGVWAQ